MPRRRPGLRALVVASVAAGSFPVDLYARTGAGPEAAANRQAVAGQGRATTALPAAGAQDSLGAGQRYAANLTGDAVGSQVRPGSEPVTREYERYAETDLAAPPELSRRMSGVLPLDGPSILTPNAGISGAALPVPVQTAQLSTPPSLLQNPFVTGETLTPDEPSAAATLRAPTATLSPVAPGDPLTADIDRDIRQVSASLAPHLDGSISVRGRSGVSGLSQLFDVETPVEASFSPGDFGRLRVVVTPTVLAAGRTDTANTRLFGTNPLAAAATPVSGGHTSTAVGAALDVGYAYDIYSADIGSSPIGFRQTNVVGGIEIAPRISNTFLVRLTADRRAVTDSILSYGGLRDPRSGQTWGGVTRNRGRVQFEGAVDTVSYYGSVGVAGLFGAHVANNVEVEAGAGFSLPVYTSPTQELRTGLNLVYFGYSRNLGNFTFGSGGYFSPQEFVALLVPVTFRHQLTPDLVYTLGASIGVQQFRASGTKVFPNDRALQAQLTATGTTTGVANRFGGFHDIGPGGGASGEVDYRVTDNLHVGAKAGFDRSGNFTEGTGLVYARYVFNDPS